MAVAFRLRIIGAAANFQMFFRRQADDQEAHAN